MDIFAYFRAGVVWFGRVGIGPLPLSVGLAGGEVRDEGTVIEKRNHLCLLGCVVWIDLLRDGEQVLDVESSDFWAGGGQLMFSGLMDCVEEKPEMVRC